MSSAGSAIKRAEMAFKRSLNLLLRLMIRRRKEVLPPIDFNFSKFLFIRQDRIGDVLVSTPLFEILKSHYPGATIDVLLSPKNHFALDHNPLIRHRWIYRKRSIAATKLLLGIRNERYDFVIDLMDNPSTTSTIFCLLSGARWSVGLEKENSYAYSITVPLLSRQDTHITERLARLLTVFDIDPSDHPMKIRYYFGPESEDFAGLTFQELGLADQPVIVTNISAGNESRFWGVGRFRILLQSLIRVYPSFHYLVLCKPGDEERAREIAEGDERIKVIPAAKTFDQFAALIRRAKVLITPDTSAVHIAAAFEIPSVVLYVQSDRSLRVWEPYGSPSESVVAIGDNLKAVSAVEVFNAFERLLEKVQAKHQLKQSTSH